MLCVLTPRASAQIIDMRTGLAVDEPVLLQLLRQQDIVLLGELHDNGQHHAVRGAFIAQLARPNTTVIAEHLPRSAWVRPLGDTRSSLEAVGFDANAWGWPLYEPLFGSILGHSLSLRGGNLAKGDSKKLVKQGDTALSATVAQAIKRAPLSATATSQLEQDLIQGHCGKLPARYLAPMQLVQRATDASMAEALLAFQPSVLVAGNGHVRKDYGVPQVLLALAPQLKVMSVGFEERGSDPALLLESRSGRYDFIWITDSVERDDPCEHLQLK